MSTPAASARTRAANVSSFPVSTPNKPFGEPAAATTSSTSSTTPRARAREGTKTLDSIRAYWFQSTGIRCAPVIEAEIRHYLHALPEFEVREAIDATCMAPRPSWAYCRAILRRLANERGR